MQTQITWQAGTRWAFGKHHMAGSREQEETTLLLQFLPHSHSGRMCFQGTEETLGAIEMFLKGSIKSVVCRHSPVRKGD